MSNATDPSALTKDRSLAAPRCDPARGGRPARVEGVTGLVEIDHERRVIRRQGLALARLAIDLDPHRARGNRPGHEQVVDPHAEVLVEVARAIVPPRVAPGLGLAHTIDVD